MKLKYFVFLLLPLILGGALWYLRQPNSTEKLFYAIRSDDLVAANAAVAQGANVNGEGVSTSGPHSGLAIINAPPLQMAVSSGRGEIVKLLLQHGAEPDRTSIDSGRRADKTPRPLGLALDSYNSGITQMLLDAKANPNIHFPLEKVSRPLEREMLIKAGADPNYTTPNGYCLMNYAGPEPKAHPFWQFLKKHGGKPRHITQGDKTPVYFWTMRGQSPRSGWKLYGDVRAGLAK